MYEDGSEAGPKGTFEIYRAEGDALYNKGDYRKAIDSYTTALELRENDKDCLVARSKCQLQLGNAQAALRDAEISLDDDGNFHKGLYQKAEALYYQGEFELALMFYHRGRKLRPELQEFRLGIQKAQEAIDNSVGSPEKVKLTKEGDLSYFADQASDSKQRGKAGGKAYNRPSTRDQRRRKDPPKSASSDKTVKQLLGELYGDRIFLEKLLKETDQPKKRNTKSGSDRGIYDLITDGIHYLDTRTDFWRQQKPMYARKRDRMQRIADAQGSKDAQNKYVIKELEKIDEEQSIGKFDASLRRAKRCLKTVESYPDEAIENKMEVVAQLHSCIGNAYLEMGDLNKAQQHHEQDYEIGAKAEIEESESRALDNLGRVYARQGKFKEAIRSWEQKLPMTKTPLETTWLYHEIGRCNLELGKYDEALSFGEKSAKAAEEAEDDMWQLNATVLVAQSQVKLNELQAALSSFETALDMAKVQGDEAAEAAIKKAIDDVNAKIVREIKEEKEAEEQKQESEAGKGSETQDNEVVSQQQKTPTPEPEPVKSPTPEPAQEQQQEAEVTQEEDDAQEVVEEEEDKKDES